MAGASYNKLDEPSAPLEAVWLLKPGGARDSPPLGGSTKKEVAGFLMRLGDQGN
jgi:hypothetical protein